MTGNTLNLNSIFSFFNEKKTHTKAHKTLLKMETENKNHSKYKLKLI